MAERTPVVTSFLRHNAEILLLKRTATNPTYPNHWNAISGILDDDPFETAKREIHEETGIDALVLVRAGEPLHVDDGNANWLVHPFLFDTPTGTPELNDENATYEWTSPTEIFWKDTVPALWETYDRIAPTPDTIATDHDHGSAYLSIRALEVLRDAAGKTAATNASTERVRQTAIRLLNARPSMAACQNRINRVMATATTPEQIEQQAISAIENARTADTNAAHNATTHIEEQTILTLSRSGTVLTALEQATPTVVIAESRPATEGTIVAETLATRGLDVTLCTDAAIAHILATMDIDAVLVGADTILADGTVVNKTGTRTAAIAAHHEAIPFYVVSADDKITYRDEPTLEHGDPTVLYDGDAPLTPTNPAFDVTPPTLINTIITETGDHHPSDIQPIATEHAKLATWQKTQQ